MKLPKSKTGMFLVERHVNGSNEGVPIAIFLTEESANNYAGSCEQNFLDANITEFNFRAHLVTFYNE